MIKESILARALLPIHSIQPSSTLTCLIYHTSPSPCPPSLTTPPQIPSFINLSICFLSSTLPVQCSKNAPHLPLFFWRSSTKFALLFLTHHLPVSILNSCCPTPHLLPPLPFKINLHTSCLRLAIHGSIFPSLLTLDTT